MSEWLLDMWVRGDPVTQGSMKHIGKGRMIHPPGVKEWRQKITAAATQHTETWFGSWEPLDEPVVVQAVFYLPKPKRPRWSVPGTRYDVDKLTRALLDALAPKTNRRPSPGAFLVDDSRVVRTDITKEYAHGMPGDGESTGVRVRVKRREC